jgi:hypothetical protein
MRKPEGGTLNKKSNSVTSGNGHGPLEMDRTTKKSSGDDASKSSGLRAGTIGRDCNAALSSVTPGLAIQTCCSSEAVAQPVEFLH